jgi:hypothetical protein
MKKRPQTIGKKIRNSREVNINDQPMKENMYLFKTTL